MGQYGKAIAEIGRARQLDPLNLMINADAAMILWDGGRYDEALEQCLRTVEMDPNFWDGHSHLAVAYWLKKEETKFGEEYLKTMA